MIKTILFLTALALVQATSPLSETPAEDSCEFLDNGCPADFDVHLLLPHETSCRKYYHCVRGEKVVRRCSSGLVFNPAIGNCDRPGSIDRVCIEDSSSEEDLPNDTPPGVIDFLPNGCPVDHTINWHLPHGYYCNVYYQCVFGQLWERYCSIGTHFNPVTQNCDNIGAAACTLPGGNYNPTTTTTSAPSSTTRPPFDLQPNGCPVDHGIHWLVPHEDCTKYYSCVWGNLIEMPCSGGLHFNPTTQECDNPATAGCANNPCNNCGSCGQPDEDCSQEGNPPVSSEEDLPPGGDDPGTNYPTTTTTVYTTTTPTTTTSTTSTTTTTTPTTTTTTPTTTTTTTPTTTTTTPTTTTTTPTTTTTTPTTTTTTPTTTTTTPTTTTTTPTTTTTTTTPTTTTTTTPTTTTTTTTPTTTTTTTPTTTTTTPTTTTTTPTTTTTTPTTTTTTPTTTTTTPTTTTTTTPTTTTTTTTTTNTPPPEDECVINPNTPDCRCLEECHILPWAHEDCDKYWTCHGNKAVLVVCSNGLHFNPSTSTCDFACYAGCEEENIQATPERRGLRLYLPWNKMDDNINSLLKTIAY